MIAYVVELDLPAALAEAYRTWLAGHVQEMLSLPGFVDAEIATRIDPPPASGRFVVNVRYRLRDRAAFDHYIAAHAPRMRAAGIAAFGTAVHATRSLLETA